MDGKVSRVVVTGFGVLSPVGNNVREFEESLREGKHGIDAITRFDTSNLKVSLAAQLKNFDVNDHIDKREWRRMDKYCQYAMVATEEAVKSSGINFENMDTNRIGVIYSSGIGGIETFQEQCASMHEKGARGVSPMFIPMLIANMAAGNIAIRYGLRGVSFAPITACATSTTAIGEAFRNIKFGYQDIIIAGGSEACITSIAVAGFQNMMALSSATNKDEASIPFDKRRSGFVLGEGAGTVILESYESAKKRGAKIYGEILGYGSTTDAYHITSPHPEGLGAANAMRAAIQEAGIKPEDVSYINAHGTSTKLNDKYETLAIKSVFGEHTKDVLVNSTKSLTGHLLGATGATEAIATMLQINGGYIHPTVNYLEKDEECDLNVSNKLINKQCNIAVSNSLGFGGHNASIVIKKGE